MMTYFVFNRQFRWQKVAVKIKPFCASDIYTVTESGKSSL